jgi:hypothetical protein
VVWMACAALALVSLYSTFYLKLFDLFRRQSIAFPLPEELDRFLNPRRNPLLKAIHGSMPCVSAA